MVYEVARKGPWTPKARKLIPRTLTVLYRRCVFPRHVFEKVGSPGLFRRENEEELIDEVRRKGS